MHSKQHSKKDAPSLIAPLLAESDADEAEDLTSLISSFQEKWSPDPEQETPPEALFVLDHGPNNNLSDEIETVKPRKEILLEKQELRTMRWLNAQLVQLNFMPENTLIDQSLNVMMYKSQTLSESFTPTLERYKKEQQDKIMTTAVVKDGFEKQHTVPLYTEGKRAKAKQRREERKKTMGDDWFDMKAPDMTDELKNDMEALSMRNQWTKTQFYKSKDYEGTPRFFQMGTVMDSPYEYYTSRIPNKQRHQTIVDELLADVNFKARNKRKYTAILKRNEEVRSKKSRFGPRRDPSESDGFERGRGGSSRGRGGTSRGRGGTSRGRGGPSRGRGGPSRGRGGPSRGRGG